MRLGRHTNGLSCEYLMQKKLKEWLEKKELRFIEELKVIRVGISRIPDFLVFSQGRLINIEAKCNDLATMIRQLDDNSKFCNYSFALIPDYCITPLWFKSTFFQKPYGLMVFNYESEIITEVIEAHENKHIDTELRKFMFFKMEQMLIKRKKAKEPDTQQVLL